MSGKTIKLLAFFVTMAVSISVGQASNETTTFKPIDFEKAKEDIISNIKKQYKVLKNMTEDFQKVFANETKQAKGLYRDLAESISWYFREPSDNETVGLDKILNKFYPFGGSESEYIDNYDKMDEFCKTHSDHLKSLRSWIRRKYSTSVVVQVSLNLILSKIDDNINHFCSSPAYTEEYINNVKKIKEINNKLVPVREQLFDATNYIKNSTYKLPKVGRFCCAFWNFTKELKVNLKDSTAANFTINLTKTYFSSATDYLCYFYPEGSSICKDEPISPKSQHKYLSIIMDMVVTLSEVVV